MPRKPHMKKFYDGRNVATRPIPLIVDSSELKAIRVAASEQKSVAKATKFPQGPRVGGVADVFGVKIGSAGTGSQGQFNPGSGLDSTI